MKNVLAPAQRPLLERFVASRVLFAFDYDGTLAPITADPAQAAMRPRTRRLLADLAELYPCIVISGRARADMRARLAGLGVRGIVGNHGVESRPGANGFAPRVRGWREILERELADWPGVTIEDKALSLAIHYRQARSRREARAAVLRAAAGLGAVRLVGGKLVVNVLPQGAADKGDALVRERRRLGCDTAVYVGDDETDEDVFRLDQPDRLLTVRVGAKRTSGADFCLRDQRQVDLFLETVLRLRRQDAGRRPAPRPHRPGASG